MTTSLDEEGIGSLTFIHTCASASRLINGAAVHLPVGSSGATFPSMYVYVCIHACAWMCKSLYERQSVCMRDRDREEKNDRDRDKEK